MSLSAAEHCLEDLPFKIYYVNDCWKANFYNIKCSFQGKKWELLANERNIYNFEMRQDNLQCFLCNNSTNDIHKRPRQT